MMARVGVAPAAAPVVLASLLSIGACESCSRSRGSDGSGPAGASLVSAPSVAASGAPRPGMAWIPAGVLRAGSAIDDVPRVADAEPLTSDASLAGFYIDALPWPNESGAIPTTNVTRDEAKRLCESKGKRLCSELEWERACKGESNSRYEYGPTYDARTCGAGTPVDTAARRPSGQRAACRSSFSVRELHGGAFEWTDSPWGRGSKTDLGVVRGGSDPEGELVSRCAYARPASLSERSPTTGFRCCAGARNEAEVHLDVKHGAPFEPADRAAGRAPPLDALDGAACGPPASPAPCTLARAWTWRPVPNVELSIAGGCIGHDPRSRCALGVSRTLGDRVETLAQIDTGLSSPEAVLVGGSEHRVRVRGGDNRGWFFRELAFDYGRVDVRVVH